MVVQIVGKQSFHSPKKDKDYFILHVLSKKDGVEGFSAEGKFVSEDIFRKASVNKQYNIVYDAYNNGNAYISDLVEVAHASN